METEDSLDTMDCDWKHLWLGDSWFGSVKTVANIGMMGHHAVMVIKTAHSRSPKKFFEETMADFPGGTWMVMEGRAEKEGVDLISVGYKYNKRKVLTFVMTKGAGKTLTCLVDCWIKILTFLFLILLLGKTSPGKPYEAKFPDKFGNVCVHQVARPAVLSTYFQYSNSIDLHNQSWQYDLALEKKWVTQDPYFRLYTTSIGMLVTDMWKIYRESSQDTLTSSSIVHFSDALAYEMIQQVQKDEDKLTGDSEVTNGVCISVGSMDLADASTLSCD